MTFRRRAANIRIYRSNASNGRIPLGLEKIYLNNIVPIEKINALCVTVSGSTKINKYV